MLIKDSAAPAADAAYDGGDDDDARSCDSISGEKPQAACDDAEQMQRCSSSFGVVAAAIVKLQAECVTRSSVCQWCFVLTTRCRYQDAHLKLRLLERESCIMKVNSSLSRAMCACVTFVAEAEADAGLTRAPHKNRGNDGAVPDLNKFLSSELARSRFERASRASAHHGEERDVDGHIRRCRHHLPIANFTPSSL